MTKKGSFFILTHTYVCLCVNPQAFITSKPDCNNDDGTHNAKIAPSGLVMLFTSTVANGSWDWTR